MEQAVNIFTGEDQVTNLFCCVCGSKDQGKLMVAPDRCTYERLGGIVCDDCCQACDYHGGCTERLAGLRRPMLQPAKDEAPLPIDSMERAFHAWYEFRRNQKRLVAFDNFDWLFRIATAKWDAYSLARRVGSV